MITVGVLYSHNDHFSLLRSEMLVGPMLMANVKYIRFLSSDINPKNLKVSGEYYRHSKWIASKPIYLDSILDLSIPKQERTAQEKSLLLKTPHSSRIDLSEFELLNLLKSTDTFKNNIPEQKVLLSFKDILNVKNKTFVIKYHNHSDLKSTMIISKEKNETWIVYAAFTSYKLSTIKLERLLKDKYNGLYFIQTFIKSVTYHDKALSFKIITQERFDGAWLSPVIRGVMSTDTPLASISYGAEALGTPLLLKDNSYIRSKKRSPSYLNLKLQRFSISIAQYIKEHFKGSPSSLEFKVAYNEDLTPMLLSLRTRSNAPSMPGRTIEFYRHLTDFLIALAQDKNQIQVAEYKPVKTKKELHDLPLLGTTIKTIVAPENFQNIFNPTPQWLDLSISYGGRTILNNLCNIHNNFLQNSYFSLRIGNAQNDIIKGKDAPTSILAIEEYLGKGLVHWNEAEFMRSLRIPLLERQFEQAQEILQGKAPDILFLDDIDLGAYSLNIEEQLYELTKTVQWFEELCKTNQIKSWGISFYNCRSRTSLKIIEMLNTLCQKNSNFKYILTSLNTLDEKVLNILKNSVAKSIILSKNLSKKEIDILHSKKIHVLQDWNELNLRESNFITEGKI